MKAVKQFPPKALNSISVQGEVLNCNFQAFLELITIYYLMWSLEMMVKVDIICINILAKEDIFDLKPFPCGQEPSNLGS